MWTNRFQEKIAEAIEAGNSGMELAKARRLAIAAESEIRANEEGFKIAHALINGDIDSDNNHFGYAVQLKACTEPQEVQAVLEKMRSDPEIRDFVAKAFINNFAACFSTRLERLDDNYGTYLSLAPDTMGSIG